MPLLRSLARFGYRQL